MVTNAEAQRVVTLGHIAVYARDGRWRRAMARSLAAAGHSHQEAADPEEMGRLLRSQRFDVLALKVRDERDAVQVAEALEGVPLPPHGILIGSAAARLLALKARRQGTLRYVPRPLGAREVTRLVDASVNAGSWDEGIAEGGAATQIEDVDVEELIESAAAAVYPQARRRRQRFATLVEGPPGALLADPVRLRRTLVTMLRIVVAAAPRGALVAVDARATSDEWTIRVGAPRAQVADALSAESAALGAACRDAEGQGGLVWAELMGGAALALCLTLPLSLEAQQDDST